MERGGPWNFSHFALCYSENVPPTPRILVIIAIKLLVVQAKLSVFS